MTAYLELRIEFLSRLSYKIEGCVRFRYFGFDGTYSKFMQLIIYTFSNHFLTPIKIVSYIYQ